MELHLRNKTVELAEPAIMGVLNITPDSFSDGGMFLETDEALKQAERMVEEGVDIIDVGGESTRPGADCVSFEQEVDRVIPVIEKIKGELDVLISIDTYKENIARIAVMEAGADVVNDISALKFSDGMAETVSDLDVPVILMHIKGSPKNMQKDPHYDDVVSEIKNYLNDRINYAVSKGVKREKIIIDPGIGFGKRFQDNIDILKNLKDFKELNTPLLIGLSRKSFLGVITDEKNPFERETETTCANIVAILNGASIIRVHNVKNAKRSIMVLRELVDI